jgi:phosphoribosylanthranilate isomerase
MLKRKVLVNGISNLSDARYCAGMFVDYLSFELNSSHPDYIAIDKILEIKNWLSGVKIGGRVSEWPEDINENQWQDLALDFMIINKSENKPKAWSLVNELFFEVGQENVDLSEYQNILSNTGLFESSEVRHASNFVGPNVTLESLDDLLANENVIGIALKGNHEIRPGESSYEDLMDVLEALEEF